MNNLSIIPPNKPLIVPLTFSKYLQEKHDLIVYQIYRHCCFGELRAKDLIHPHLTWRHVKASEIAHTSCYVKVLSKLGEDWDSPDPSIRQTTRKKGHEISQQEAMWQIQQINSKLQTLKEQ
jgi:hypothetical protein